MKEHFIKCDCGDPHHQMILYWDDETPDKGNVRGIYDSYKGYKWRYKYE